MPRAIRLWFWFRVMDALYLCGGWRTSRPTLWRLYVFAVERASANTDWGRP